MTATAEAMDLTVKFGNQSRAKCPTCRCFMSQSGDQAKCGRCGRVFDRQTDGLFVVRTRG